MNHTFYQQAEDLLNDVLFRKWAKGEMPESNDYWEHWQLLNPDKTEIFNQALAIMYVLQTETIDISDNETVEHIEYIKSMGKSREVPLKQSVFKIFQKRWIYMAASVLLVLGTIGIYFKWLPENSEIIAFEKPLFNSSATMLEKVNNSDKPLTIKLSDSSTVTLKEKSRISYLEHFQGQKREVYLEGEAFFEVAKDPNRPFFVYANEIVTKVLGTSFNIKAYQSEKNVLVTVRTGRVSVFSRSDLNPQQTEPKYQTKGVILTPNQQVEYSREFKTLNKGLIVAPELITDNGIKQNFIYQDVPLKQIFDQFEEIYGIHIIYNEQSISNCTLEADLSDENSLYDKLNVICKIMGATYEIVDGQIVIYSPGCTF